MRIPPPFVTPIWHAGYQYRITRKNDFHSRDLRRESCGECSDRSGHIKTCESEWIGLVLLERDNPAEEKSRDHFTAVQGQEKILIRPSLLQTTRSLPNRVKKTRQSVYAIVLRKPGVPNPRGKAGRKSPPLYSHLLTSFDGAFLDRNQQKWWWTGRYQLC